MAQAVSCRPVTTEARIRSQISALIFVVDNVAQREASARISVSPLSIISTTLLTHLLLHAAFTRRTDGRTLEASQKAMLFRKLQSGG